MGSSVNCFKGNVEKTYQRRGGAHMGFSERIEIVWNWTGADSSMAYTLQMTANLSCLLSAVSLLPSRVSYELLPGHLALKRLFFTLWCPAGYRRYATADSETKITTSPSPTHTSTPHTPCVESKAVKRTNNQPLQPRSGQALRCSDSLEVLGDSRPVHRHLGL